MRPSGWLAPVALPHAPDPALSLCLLAPSPAHPRMLGGQGNIGHNPVLTVCCNLVLACPPTDAGRAGRHRRRAGSSSRGRAPESAGGAVRWATAARCHRRVSLLVVARLHCRSMPAACGACALSSAPALPCSAFMTDPCPALLPVLQRSVFEQQAQSRAQSKAGRLGLQNQQVRAPRREQLGGWVVGGKG